MSRIGTFAISEIHKLPYIRRVPDHGRVIPLKPYWDHLAQDWHLYFVVSETELGRIGGGEPVVGSYLSAEPAVPSTDREWPLGTYIVQHLSFPGVLPWLERFEHRYYQLAVALDKYDLVTHAAPDHSRYMVVAELEYAIVIVRSLYDLLQKLIAALAETVRVATETERRLIQDLPHSFAGIVLEGNVERSASALTAKYGLPPPIAEFFEAEARYFRVLRDIRVGIEHHGKAGAEVYSIGPGFGVLYKQAPWNELDIWSEHLIKDERFGSLRLILASLAKRAFDATTRFAEAFGSCIGVPLALGENLRLYLRHPAGSWLVRLEDIVASPWEADPPSTAP